MNNKTILTKIRNTYRNTSSITCMLFDSNEDFTFK